MLVVISYYRRIAAVPDMPLKSIPLGKTTQAHRTNPFVTFDRVSVSNRTTSRNISLQVLNPDHQFALHCDSIDRTFFCILSIVAKTPPSATEHFSGGMTQYNSYDTHNNHSRNDAPKWDSIRYYRQQSHSIRHTKTHVRADQIGSRLAGQQHTTSG